MDSITFNLVFKSMLVDDVLLEDVLAVGDIGMGTFWEITNSGGPHLRCIEYYCFIKGEKFGLPE